MTLAAVRTGRRVSPLRVMLYGPEGIGKSTFGANAPAAIFLGAEDGTDEIECARLPEPYGWRDVIDGVRMLAIEKHAYETLVVDTLDWLEPLVWQFCCERDKKKDIEDYGFGKGYVAALGEWRNLIAALENLRRTRAMNVVLLAHSHVKNFKNPDEGDDFDRYQLKVHEKAGGLCKEWCDAVLFANYETHVVRSKSKRAKGYGGATRVLHTQRRAAFDAKNRFGLPEQMALDWAEFVAAVEAGRSGAAVTSLRAEIEAAIAVIAPDEAAKVTAWLATDTAQDAGKLRVALNRITEKTRAAAAEAQEGTVQS